MSHHHEITLEGASRAFTIAIGANGLFVVVQLIVSMMAHSTSLLADAVHNLGDVMGLLLSALGHHLQSRLPTETATYGFKKISILATLANGMVLVFTCGMIAMEACYAFFYPRVVDASLVIWVAVIGILVNGATAMLFLKGKRDLNLRAAFLHLMSDAVISMGVVIAALIIKETAWMWVDPIMGLFIAILILKSTWGLFKQSFRLVMDGVPHEISIAKVRELFLAEPGVKAVHDLHIWALGTRDNALSVHLYMPNEPLTDNARLQLEKRLKLDHGIHHTTIQVERIEKICDNVCG